MPKGDSRTRKLHAVPARAVPPAVKKRRAVPRKGPRGIEYRRVFKVGGSYAVTLSPASLRLLRAQDGASVQVVPHSSGKVIIAPMRMRIGAAHELVAATRELAYLRKVNGKLRKRLMAFPARSVAQGVSIGYTKAWQKELMDLSNKIDAQRVELAGFQEWLFKHFARPVPSSSPGSLEGGAVASGGHPPGHPLEH